MPYFNPLYPVYVAFDQTEFVYFINRKSFNRLIVINSGLISNLMSSQHDLKCLFYIIIDFKLALQSILFCDIFKILDWISCSKIKTFSKKETKSKNKNIHKMCGEVASSFKNSHHPENRCDCLESKQKGRNQA